MAKKDTCRGAVQCKWTDLCDGRTQQHHCIFQPMAYRASGPLSGRLSEGFSDIFMAEARGRHPTSYPSGTITSRRIDDAYREDHLFLPVLKGQCHNIFCFRFFHESSSPKPIENSIRVISNFFKNSLRYLQVKVHHWYQRHRRQIWPLLPLVPTTPAVNLPPVSVTLVANNWDNVRLLKWTWRQKFIYIYVNSSTQRCPNKIIKTFLIEDFFQLPPVSLTLVVCLELRISLQKKKNERALMQYSGAWRKLKSKISWPSPFKEVGFCSLPLRLLCTQRAIAPLSNIHNPTTTPTSSLLQIPSADIHVYFV